MGSSHASTLRDFFGSDRVAYSETSSNSKTTRSFTSFSQGIREIVDARVYSGVHFRSADAEGGKLGERIARYRARHYFRPRHELFHWERDSLWQSGSQWNYDASEEG